MRTRSILCLILVALALAACTTFPRPLAHEPATAPLAQDPTTAPLPRLESGMHTALISRIATDAAGRWAVTASEDKTARVWEIASGRLAGVLRPPQDRGREGLLSAVAMSPDGGTVAVGGWTQFNAGRETIAADGFDIYLFDRASGRLLRRISGLPNVVLHLAWSPDGRWLAASLWAGGVRVFDAATGAEAGRDAECANQSYSAHFSPDGRRIVTTCFDGRVRLYAVEGDACACWSPPGRAAGCNPSLPVFPPTGAPSPSVFPTAGWFRCWTPSGWPKSPGRLRRAWTTAIS